MDNTLINQYKQHLVFYIALTSATIVLFSSCATVTPVNNHYEKAGTLGQGNIETAVSYTNTVADQYRKLKTINTNVGFFAGYGLLKNLDLKLQYEKLKPYSETPNVFVQEEYFSVSTKFSVMPQKAALMLLFSSYKKHTREGSGIEDRTITSVAPHFVRTFTNRAKTIDITATLKTDVLISELWALNFGMNIGAGFSSDLSKWAIRPEIGYYTDLAFGNFVFAGIALRYSLPFPKK